MQIATGTTLPSQNISRTTTASKTTSATPASGADIVRSKMLYVALFGFGIVVTALL